MDNTDTYKLDRFIKAQGTTYETALGEIKNGYKTSHWMWWIFPQLKGLGRSSRSYFYGIDDLCEAKQYLEDEILGSRMRECCTELLKLQANNPVAIFGGIDARKLRSSMTLFDAVSPNDIYSKVIEVFYSGKRDAYTLRLIEEARTCHGVLDKPIKATEITEQ